MRTGGMMARGANASRKGPGWAMSADRARMATLCLPPRPTESNADHAVIVDAIARRDPAAARRLHHEHRVRSGRTLDLLERHGINQL
ncbi:MAG: FCD domain-containing protein [Inquilinus sp.]|nr:FCD domain-containing protein [Inquilinus sp.]